MHGVLRRASLATVVLTLLLAATAHAAVISPPLRTSGAKIVDRDGAHGRAAGRQLVRLRDQRPRGPRAVVARPRRHDGPGPADGLQHDPPAVLAAGAGLQRADHRSRLLRWQERRAAGQDAAAGDGRRDRRRRAGGADGPAREPLAGRRRLQLRALVRPGRLRRERLGRPVAGARAALQGQDERHRRRSEERAARRRHLGHRRPDGLAARGHAGGQRGHRDRAELAHRRRGDREARRRRQARQRTGGAATSRACAGTRCASSGRNRLVYSPHEYGPGVFPQPWFGRADTAKQLERRWRDGWGFIASRASLRC